MQSLSNRIQTANALLATFAVPIEGTLGREITESPDETRFPFQRDRDRIIHSLSFRRLKGKTQVFVAGVGDHYRTRLTHTMEVAQISRDIARTLGLNEDLAESVALAHDLGHPPFGHAGEEALDLWMRQFKSGFEHNTQSLRIVTVLESHSSLFKGLNLTIEILEGLLKHRTPHDQIALKFTRQPSLEAQTVNVADEIAYTGHDCDDGLRAELFTEQDLLKIRIPAEAILHAEKRGTSLRGAIIHLLVTDLYEETDRSLEAHGIKTLDDVYACPDPTVRFSPRMRDDLSELREFLWKHMYLHPSVQDRAHEGQTLITKLCTEFHEHPNEKIRALMQTNDSKSEEAVKDYVAGMTDAFAAANSTLLHY